MEKCLFFMEKIVFLGFVVSKDGVQVHEDKEKAIRDWPRPTNVKEIWSFHCLAIFYRWFVRDFSTIASPLNELVKKALNFIGAKAKKKNLRL
jgi:hypothetical protein